MDGPALFPRQPVTADLSRVDRRVRAAVPGHDTLLDQVQRCYLRAPGKRLRPLLLFVPWYLRHPGRPVAEPLATAGAVVELLHTGSLHHDDVMDRARLRRGRPTANATWGDDQSILAGNMLTARAFRYAATLGEPAHRAVLDTYEAMCGGQSAEIRSRYRVDRTAADYVEAVRGKTAALTRLCTLLGALLTGYDEEDVERLTGFGERFGMAFQLSDDIADVVADPVTLGKPTAGDVREGTYTLPLILALRADPSLAELLTDRMDPATASEVCRRVADTDAIDASRRVAERHLAVGLRRLTRLEAVDPDVLRGVRALTAEVFARCAEGAGPSHRVPRPAVAGTPSAV